VRVLLSLIGAPDEFNASLAFGASNTAPESGTAAPPAVTAEARWIDSPLISIRRRKG
jgi:hypothetical protein